MFGSNTSSANLGGFGSPSGFGASTTTGFGAPATTGFGAPATTGFGAPATTGFGAPATTGFGAPATTGFGSSAATGFGANANAGFGPNNNAFGANTNTGFGASANTNFGAKPNAGFGANATTGFGANATTGFGTNATTGFGANATTGFGNTTNSGFGANNNSGFGANNNAGFGNTTNSGFGANNNAFGANNNAFSANTNTGFGANNNAFGTKPNAGFGANNTAGFGANATTGFGANATTGFGANNTAGFGANATTGFGANAATGFGISNTNASKGTVSPYKPVTKMEKNETITYMCITCMNEYKNKTLEEIRLQDYIATNKWNKNGHNPAAGFGANTNTGFGANNTNNAFGANNNAFGANNNAFGAKPAGFGGANTTNAFGAINNTAGGFGNNTTNAFGANNTTNAFGANNTTNAFGANNTTNAFGANNTTNAFGANNTNTGFGANNNTFGAKPATGFGTNTTTGFGASNTTNAFGANNTTNTFGANNTNTGFGANTNTAFGANTNTAFGANNTTNTFGANNAFGAKPATGFGTNTNGFGGATSNTAFGANTNTAFGAKPATGFGANTNTAFGASNNAFGANNNAFGANTNAFGANNNAFGAKPATGFGGATTNAFGGATANAFGGATANTFGSTTSAFGAKPITGFGGNNLSTFGSTQNTIVPSTTISFTPQDFDYYQLNKKINSIHIQSKVPTVLPSNITTPVASIPISRLQKQTIDDKNTSATRISNTIKQNSVSPVPMSSLDSLTTVRQETLSRLRSMNKASELMSPASAFYNTSIKIITSKPVEEVKTPVDTDITICLKYNNSIHDINVVTDMTVTELKQKIVTDQLFTEIADSEEITLLYHDTKLADEQKLSETSVVSHSVVDIYYQNSMVASQSHRSSIVSTVSDESVHSDVEPEVISFKQTTISANPPVLTKSDYSLSPSLESLQEMSDLELSNVEHFKVIREDYGSIEWFDPVDLRGLDLDEIIHIDKDENNYSYVEVYNNTDEKDYPKIGEGLNKPARITLYNITPKKQTPEGIESFIKTLKNSCRRNDSTFVNYDCEHFIWKFNVKHFTKYGIEDCEEDEEEDTLNNNALLISQQTKQSLPSLSSNRYVSKNAFSSPLLRKRSVHISHTNTSDSSLVSPFTLSSSVLPVPLDGHKTIESQSNVYDANNDDISFDTVNEGFFLEPSIPSQSNSVDVIASYLPDSIPDSFMLPSLSDIDTLILENSKYPLSPCYTLLKDVKNTYSKNSITPEGLLYEDNASFITVADKTMCITRKRIEQNIDIDMSEKPILGKDTMGLCSHRHSTMNVCTVPLVPSKEDSRINSVVLPILDTLISSNPIITEDIHSHVSVYEKTGHSSLFSSSLIHTLLEKFVNITMESSTQFKEHVYYAYLFQFLQIFVDKENESSIFTQEMNSETRSIPLNENETKNLCLHFISELLQSPYYINQLQSRGLYPSDNHTDDKYKDVFLCICIGDLSRATEILSTIEDDKLTTILYQLLNPTSCTPEFIKSLEDFAQSDPSGSIYKKNIIYLMTKNESQISYMHLHWLQYLYIAIKYLYKEDVPLSTILTDYTKKFKQEKAPYPVPFYIMESISSINTKSELNMYIKSSGAHMSARGKLVDPLYILMNICFNNEYYYSNIDILNPYNFSPCSLDVSMNWLFYSILISYHLLSVDTKQLNSISTQFSDSLYRYNHIKHALYIITYINDIHTKSNLISTYISKDIQEIIKEEDDFLLFLNFLSIPLEFYTESRTMYAIYTHDCTQFPNYLVKHRLFDELDEYILKTMIPIYWSSKDMNTLSSYIQSLNPYSSSLSHYETCFKKLLSYIDLLKQTHDLFPKFNINSEENYITSCTTADITILEHLATDICMYLKCIPIDMISTSINQDICIHLIKCLILLYAKLPVNLNDSVLTISKSIRITIKDICELYSFPESLLQTIKIFTKI